MSTIKPLEGLLVVEFSQFLAGPFAGLRLADLGARVIKIERPDTGDSCRQINLKDLFLDGDSYPFHVINRNKESYTANLKHPQDLEQIKELLKIADVVTHNFRPGVMDRFGLDYASLRAMNPEIIYAEITGYGTDGPWKSKPGQDLLVQALSGLTYLTGDRGDSPMPFGLAVVDTMAGAHLCEGILAALYQREISGQGSHIEVSLLESAVDLQFEVFTIHLNDGGSLPDRGQIENAHAYLGAPYGIYATADGYLALAMGSIPRLGKILDCQQLEQYSEPEDGFIYRGEITQHLANHLKTRPTAAWMAALEEEGYWASQVLTWDELTASDGFTAMDMVQEVTRSNGVTFRTTRCPVHIDDHLLIDQKAAPVLGEDTAQIKRDLQAGEISGWHRNEDKNIHMRSEGDRDHRPLSGLLVVDLGQFLAGPSSALRLADLGARVVKIERPDGGEVGRHLYLSNAEKCGESVLFQAINRNKDGFAADLKNPQDYQKVISLIQDADILIQNFRPGVAERLQVDYHTLRDMNPQLIYGSVSGYGTKGPWQQRPGQDLLVQALSGLTWLNGDADDPPTPMGLSVADILAGEYLTQGILSLLLRRQRTGIGGRVEVSLLEAAMDLQFEVFSAYLNDGGQLPKRSRVCNAHAYLGAPYGIFPTADGFLALAMGSVPELGRLLHSVELQEYTDPEVWYSQRDEIKEILLNHLQTKSADDWFEMLDPADVWCARVMNWQQLRSKETFQALDMTQTVQCNGPESFRTTRCPIRSNGQIFKSQKPAPAVGEYTDRISQEFNLEE